VLKALFRGTLDKDLVGQAWRKVKAHRNAWCRRDLASQDVVRLVLDGTVSGDRSCRLSIVGQPPRRGAGAGR
jgi:hypothetical protein